MATPYLPRLSVILNDKFVVAPANTSATAENVARIFEPLGIDGDTPSNAAVLPIHLVPKHSRRNIIGGCQFPQRLSLPR